MSSLYLTVEVIAGSEIKEAAMDALRLALRTGVTVSFKFNGVECLVSDPSCKSIPDMADLLAERWQAALQSDSQFKFASV